MHPSDRAPRPPHPSRPVGRVLPSSAAPSSKRRASRRGRGRKVAGSCSDRAVLFELPGPSALVSTLIAAAVHEFSRGRPDRADAFLRLIPRAVSHAGTTWRQLGQLLFEGARYEEAGRAFGQAAAFFPRDAGIQVRLARVCLCLKDVSGFEGYLQRALSLNPADPAAIELVAEVNRDHGDPAFAARLYARLLRSGSGGSERQRHRRQSLAECCLRLGPAATAAALVQIPGLLARPGVGSARRDDGTGTQGNGGTCSPLPVPGTDPRSSGV